MIESVLFRFDTWLLKWSWRCFKDCSRSGIAPLFRSKFLVFRYTHDSYHKQITTKTPNKYELHLQ